jgi:hypothetical protein
VLVKVYFGYVDGVANRSTCAGQPAYGQLVSERVRGVQRLELWPVDFPMNTKTTTTITPARLWRPEVSVVLEHAIAFSGLEQVRRRWVAQRWFCEPKSAADIDAELRASESCRPREILPYHPPGR